MSSSLLSRPYLSDHWRLVEDGAARPGDRRERSQWRIARDVLVAPTSAVARERARAVLGGITCSTSTPIASAPPR